MEARLRACSEEEVFASLTAKVGTGPFSQQETSALFRSASATRPSPHPCLSQCHIALGVALGVSVCFAFWILFPFPFQFALRVSVRVASAPRPGILAVSSKGGQYRARGGKAKQRGRAGRGARWERAMCGEERKSGWDGLR